MRDGFRLSIALNEFVVGAVCIAVSACTVGYLYTHMPPKVAPAPAVACAPKEPEVTIESIVYFIPVPAPKVNVKVVIPKPKKEYFGEDDGDNAAPDTNVKPQNNSLSDSPSLSLAKADPVFPHRKPIIPPALKQPIQR
jgi:hypothetical protein